VLFYPGFIRVCPIVAAMHQGRKLTRCSAFPKVAVILEFRAIETFKIASSDAFDLQGFPRCSRGRPFVYYYPTVI
jgi:hypothetical protein